MDIFATAATALYVGHHIGDYWVQTNHQAQHKGGAGAEGRVQCIAHVVTYTLTQLAVLIITFAVLGIRPHWSVNAALLVSAVTHYLADRRDHGLMFALIRGLEPFTGKATFAKLGAPRPGREDNPSLATGAWALDQSWHIVFGVWIPALIIAAMA